LDYLNRKKNSYLEVILVLGRVSFQGFFKRKGISGLWNGLVGFQKVDWLKKRFLRRFGNRVLG